MDDTADLPAPNTALVPAVPPELLEPQALAKLAQEIAMNIRDVPAILKDYNITEEDFKKYVDNLPLFRRILEAAVIDWNAAGTTHERLKIEAAITLEAGLKHIGARMVKDDED